MKNMRYHGPLITDGVALGHIYFSWISFFISSFLYVASIFNDKLGVVTILFLFCVLISLFCILLSFVKKIIYCFQSFTYLLIALIILVLLIDLNFIGLMMFVSGGEIFLRVYSVSSAMYVIAMLTIFIIACSIYTWHYLPKNRGKIWKINRFETYNLKNKKKKTQFTDSFVTIFGVVLFLSSLLTGYLENIFGLFLGILMTSTLSAVIIDALYAAIYVRKYPEEEAL